MALAIVFALSSLAMANWDPPAPVYNDGTADVKIDQVQGAAGVAGLVVDVTSEKGHVFKTTDSTSVSGSGAFGLNDFNSVDGSSCFSKDGCFKEGVVGVGHFDFNYDKVHTCGTVYVDNKTIANVYQNTSSMNSSLIASASACQLPVTANASQSQTFTQNVVNAVIPNPNAGWGQPATLGTVNSGYVGNTAASVKIGN
jgi:hypothetical protein